MNSFTVLKNVKTLLVDDDALQVVETAEAGLKAIKEEQFDIIISDLRLPGMNGLDFLKLARASQPDAINILITAYRDDYILSDAIGMGVAEIIEKPFSVRALVDFLALSLKRQAKKQLKAGRQ